MSTEGTKGDAMQEVEYGFCPTCNGLYKIRKNGTIRKHERKEFGLYGGVRFAVCPGSGKKPKGSS